MSIHIWESYIRGTPTQVHFRASLILELRLIQANARIVGRVFYECLKGVSDLFLGIPLRIYPLGLAIRDHADPHSRLGGF